jgi:preprotein translocase subunit SecF
MNWSRFRWLYFLISVLVIIPGVISLLMYGLKPGIDFTGGTLLEYQFSAPVEQNQLESIVKETGFIASGVQSSGENTYLFRLSTISKDEAQKIKETLSQKLALDLEEVRFETVGPILGKELLRKTLIAVLMASVAILTYVGWRFKEKKFGVCAVLAMFHDSLVILGIFSLLGHFFGVEVDTLFVTAVLTILSFSVHDTVVVYDRIRESKRIFPNTSFEQLVNKAISETLVRSLNNSLTIIFMLLALLLLGGETIRWFVAALLIGTISGTYSSTFTAAPLLVVWHKLAERKKS